MVKDVKALEKLQMSQLRRIRGQQQVKLNAADEKGYALVLDGNDKMNSLSLVRLAGVKSETNIILPFK